MDHLENNTIIQIGIVVRDVEDAATRYAQIFGVPKPQIVAIAADSFANTHYRGQPSNAWGKAAFFDMGAVQLELIEPVGAPSTWEEFLRLHGEGIHHIAVRVEQLEEAQAFLAARGMPVVQSGGWDGGRYAYIDSVKQLGAMLELLKFDRETSRQ